MRPSVSKPPACLLLALTSIFLNAQTTSQPVISADARTVQLERRLETISSALVAARQQVDQSLQQIHELQQELAEIKQQLPSAQTVPPNSSSSIADPLAALKTSVTDVQERQDTLEAQVKLHDQTKVESDSKYPIHLSGLVLFNAFANRGNVDNIDLPAIAISQPDGASGGSLGAGLRQTILGIEGSGPRIAGARTSANVNMDFFAGLAYANFGTSAGIVRMRTASINLDWPKDSVQAGLVGPLISPLSPTSYATVAEPGMAWAGNLWTWAPQLRYAHQFPLQEDKHVQFEFGLWDTPSSGYNTSDVLRSPSPSEQSRQPAYETRVSYGTSSVDRGLQVGLGGYYSRQHYPYNNNDSWAATVDWRVPLGARFEFSGEGYRGRSLGGLGGGVYKDVLYGTNPVTGAPAFVGLNAIGGWAQFKSHFTQSFEANAATGQDNGFADDFHSIILPSTATSLQLRARNRMIVGNLIYRPKTYLIFSPEYRRIWTWPIYGQGNTADVFTLSMGYQF
ncbi:hypothetical protein EDE15_0952 [Edaphobacter aggregans]|uniref:DUF3138 family protein n=1 Tax=Edaphobacter aggregans TaxID=570835 RepID=A0A428MF99_9BACT|nr:hypothetical protein [Edaphobacter aggregans]RSL15463.1 hypothetical protein EDE15_0952 [Edaphobacter aggregans]